MDKRLGEADYLGGEYSIADIATFPWVVGTRREPEQLESRPNFKRWLDAIEASSGGEERHGGDGGYVRTAADRRAALDPVRQQAIRETLGARWRCG